MRGPTFRIVNKRDESIGTMYVESLSTGEFVTSIKWYIKDMKESEDAFNHVVRNGVAGFDVRLIKS